MKNNYDDISDDEIMVLVPKNHQNKQKPGDTSSSHRKPALIVWLVIAIVFLTGLLIWLLITHDTSKTEDSSLRLKSIETTETIAVEESTITADDVVSPVNDTKSYVNITDTIINDIGLTIFVPEEATPQLVVGPDALSDTTAVFVVQAADIRGDNGEIVGAYVDKGHLLSKGQAKSGFCAIIGGNITVGVADSTPFLEQALETDGYFFRQYPLVVANQVVENKPKGRSLRKALAELNGHIVVIMSHRRLTFHDFAQSLVDLGVKNAIYLVGSSAYGFAIDSQGTKIEFGQPYQNPAPNTNYIVWH